MIEIRCHSEPGTLVLEVLGDVCAAGPVLASSLDAACEAGVPNVIVDLRAVGTVDSATTATLRSAAAKFAQSGGRLRVRDLPRRRPHDPDLASLDEHTGRAPDVLVGSGRSDVVLGDVVARGGGLRTASSLPRPTPDLAAGA
jgi:anti-anti-sigma regulatory factor